MPRVKLTKTVIDALPIPLKDIVHWDTGCPGFGVKVILLPSPRSFQRLGQPPEATVSEKWHPKDAPTAVQIVEILQMVRCNALRSPARRLAIMLSAWDKVEAEGLDPEPFLARELPFLDQYLRQGAGGWEFRIYGLSAQGGDYEPELREGEEIDPDLKAKVDAIQKIEEASARIRLLSPSLSTDLTEPIAWLTE